MSSSRPSYKSSLNTEYICLLLKSTYDISRPPTNAILHEHAHPSSLNIVYRLIPLMSIKNHCLLNYVHICPQDGAATSSRRRYKSVSFPRLLVQSRRSINVCRNEMYNVTGCGLWDTRIVVRYTFRSFVKVICQHQITEGQWNWKEK